MAVSVAEAFIIAEAFVAAVVSVAAAVVVAEVVAAALVASAALAVSASVSVLFNKFGFWRKSERSFSMEERVPCMYLRRRGFFFSVFIILDKNSYIN